MSTAVVHRTPGLLDMQAITVMGLSAKPRSTNPIGMFGTGLKYAIATLCRNGCSPVFVIGRDRYTFTGKPRDFRGKEYLQVRARLDTPRLLRPKYITLPFTTEYGKFWHPWMAYRELESNTRDEGGSTELIEDWGPDHDLMQHPDSTCIVVDLPEYVHAHMLAHETFLPDGLREGRGIQVMPQGGDRLYWRGLRVKDLPKPTVFTYNFLDPLELTEDRTLKSDWHARYALAQYIATAETDETVIAQVLTADANKWEHRLEWQYVSQPSPQFIRTADRWKADAPGILPIIGKWLPPAPGTTPWERHPRPWALEEGVIYDSLGVAVLQRPHEPPTGWDELARVVVGRINGADSVRVEAHAGGSGGSDQASRAGGDSAEIPF
jgi:hypothetical protein